MDSSSRPPVALIAGPTASGKSALALALAERRNGVLVNADSAQVYADLRIVSARPTPRDEQRAPHRLYGYVDAATACSAAAWAADAEREIAAAHADGRLPIIVGGTGLYIRTLLDGIAPVPEIDPAVRAEVRALPVAEAFSRLEREDPEAAARLRPGDTTRVARALEVVRSTGRALSAWQSERRGGIGDRISLLPLLLLPPRPWLHARCDTRFETMMSDGGVEEVRALLGRELPPSLPAMRAIGVREIAALIRRALDREAALAAGQAATRRYAKRQYTWFNNQPPPGWPRLADPIDCGGLENGLARFDAHLPR
ncbi:MAG TPA: tRNA (adenosine(37)-N6)-dimethylallyltransferase MiaA [Allosphingosinicella sp.]|nr:tRNA (adenosine(37)-N6)-dimethylallyltransferase MiaA [Allosphingosinicella sp.]